MYAQYMTLIMNNSLISTVYCTENIYLKYIEQKYI